MSATAERRWAVIVDRHRSSVDQFVAAAIGIPEDRWLVPIADEKWTPSQITEHVTKTYEMMIQQLRTGQGLPVQTGWFLRQVLRMTVLRSIMWTRRLPAGAKAPRDLRPDDSGLGQAEAVERLQRVVAEFVTELDARRGQRGVQLTHHIFGSVDATRGLDFLAVHTEHHGRQLAGRVAAPVTTSSSLH